jgi:hypothetical protein
VTPRPAAGLRLSVTITTPLAQTAQAVTYCGFVHLPDADVNAEVTVALPGGAVNVALGDGGTPEMAKVATALIRAATKPHVASGRLPRKIVRWRG